MPRIPFQKPKKVEWEILSDRYGRLVAEPFEKGYALTVGNSLRRTLLSIVPGAAVAWVKIDGVRASDTKIPGVTESLADVLLDRERLPAGTAAEQGGEGPVGPACPGLHPRRNLLGHLVEVAATDGVHEVVAHPGRDELVHAAVPVADPQQAAEQYLGQVGRLRVGQHHLVDEPHDGQHRYPDREVPRQAERLR